MTYIVFKREFLKIISSWGFLITTFGMPLMLGAYFLFLGGISLFAGSQIGESKRSDQLNSSPIGLLDETQILFEPNQKLSKYKNGDRYLYREEKRSLSDTELLDSKTSTVLTYIVFRDTSLAKLALKEGDISRLIRIPEDYLEAGEIELINLEKKSANQISSYQHESALDNIWREALLTKAEVPSEIMPRLKRHSRYVSKVLDEKGDIIETEKDSFWSGNLLKSFASKGVSYLFVGLVIAVIIGNSNSLLRSMNAERESKLIDVLLTTLTARQLITGKVTGILCASLLQLMIWMGMGLIIPLIFGRYSPVPLEFEVSSLQIFFLVSFAALGMLFYGFFYAALGAFKKDPQELSSMRKLGMMIQLIVFYSLILFLPNASDFAWRMLSTIPFFTPFLMPILVVDADFPIQAAAIHLSLLALFTAIMAQFSARIFRIRMMYLGQSVGAVFLLKSALRFKE